MDAPTIGLPDLPGPAGQDFRGFGTPPRLYSLLFVNEAGRSHANLRKGVADPIDVYLRCALTLQRSCVRAGTPYALITNDPALLQRRLAAIGATLPLVQVAFDRELPATAPFYEAHFKLDVIRAFGTGVLGKRVGLVDVDMVLMRPLDIDEAFWSGRNLLAYDLTGTFDSNPATMVADLERAGSSPGAPPRWFGGEFIVGGHEAFRALSKCIEEAWPRYRANIDAMVHVGDEAVVSAALANLRHRGLGDVLDVAEVRRRRPVSVARWWTARTAGPQPRLGDVAAAGALHLPADKEFLAAWATRPFEPIPFLRAYRAHARRKLLARHLANIVDACRGRPAKHVGRL